VNISLTFNVNINLDPKTGQTTVTVQAQDAAPDAVTETVTPAVVRTTPQAVSAPPKTVTSGAHEPQSEPRSIQFNVQDQKNQRNQLSVPEEYQGQIEIKPFDEGFWDQAAWDLWVDFVPKFLHADPLLSEDPQKRSDLFTALASSPKHWMMLRAIVSLGGLQVALRDFCQRDVDKIESVANLMVQISHSCLPELVQTYDYSSAWRRKIYI
jgi:hypothetical protein